MNKSPQQTSRNGSLNLLIYARILNTYPPVLVLLLFRGKLMMTHIKHLLTFSLKPCWFGIFDLLFEVFNSESNQENKYFSNSYSLFQSSNAFFHLSINLFAVFEMWDRETKTPPVVLFYS